MGPSLPPGILKRVSCLVYNSLLITDFRSSLWRRAGVPSSQRSQQRPHTAWHRSNYYRTVYVRDRASWSDRSWYMYVWSSHSFLQRNLRCRVDRIAGAVTEINALKDAYNRGEYPIKETTDIHAICDLVKSWFRVLPEPMFPPASYHEVMDAMSTFCRMIPSDTC